MHPLVMNQALHDGPVRVLIAAVSIQDQDARDPVTGEAPHEVGDDVDVCRRGQGHRAGERQVVVRYAGMYGRRDEDRRGRPGEVQARVQFATEAEVDVDFVD